LAIILHIDTATEFASICLSKENQLLGVEVNEDQKNHASFLQPAIQKLFHQTNLKLQEIDAISVTNGPGSYTGLRVGLASAKGLCFALQKPLITLNTLNIMAVAAIMQHKDKEALYCPMIDARRMEVFTTLYTFELIQVTDQKAIILNETSFGDYLKNNKIICSGSGAEKFKKLINSQNAFFSNTQHNAKHMIALVLEKFENKDFSNLAYTTPDYGKAFYSTAKKLD